MSQAKVDLLLQAADSIRIAAMDAAEEMGLPPETLLMMFGDRTRPAHEYLLQYAAADIQKAPFMLRFLIDFIPEPPPAAAGARGAFRKGLSEAAAKRAQHKIDAAAARDAAGKPLRARRPSGSLFDPPANDKSEGAPAVPPNTEQLADGEAQLRALIEGAGGGELTEGSQGLPPEVLADGEAKLRELIASQQPPSDDSGAIGEGAVI